MILATAIASPAFASAGELRPAPAGGFDYAFSGCAKPAEPDMAVDPTLKARARALAENERVKAYNVYIEGVNEYVDCLGAEAKRDLEAYYAAVNTRLEAEQEAIFGRAEELKPRKRPAKK
jgi:hypothetical protein